MCAKLFSYVRLFVTLWTVACQAPLSMGFSRQEYWSGFPCPHSEDLPDPGIEPKSLTSSTLAGGFFYHCAMRADQKSDQGTQKTGTVQFCFWCLEHLHLFCGQTSVGTEIQMMSHKTRTGFSKKWFYRTVKLLMPQILPLTGVLNLVTHHTDIKVVPVPLWWAWIASNWLRMGAEWALGVVES